MLTLFGRAGVTDIVQLNDVPAELCAYGWADLAGFEFVDGFFKRRNHHAVGEPAQITAAARAAVLRVLARQTGEVRAAAGLCIDLADGTFRACRRVVVVGFNQNVLRIVLAQRLAFGQGDALLFRLFDGTCNFGIADAAVLHDCLLVHFFRDNTVRNFTAGRCRRVFQ